MPVPLFFVDREKSLNFRGTAQKRQAVSIVVTRNSVQKWPEIGKLVQIAPVLLLGLPSWQQLGYFWTWLLGALVAGLPISISVFSDKIAFC